MEELTVSQLFERASDPVRLGRNTLDRTLRDWRVSARRYLLHLKLSQLRARRYGSAVEVEAFNAAINKHKAQDQLPTLWNLDYFFSEEGYGEYGRPLFDFWVMVIMAFAVQTQSWDEELAAFKRASGDGDPYRLPGFTPSHGVWSSGWLTEFQRIAPQLDAVYPGLSRLAN